MKNIITKIIKTFIVIVVIAIILKVGDIYAQSTTQNVNCGVNNGYIWNGTQCVNTCDAFHPWDAVNKRCATYGAYYTNTNYTSTNCSVYGANYYYNGSICAQRTQAPSATYLPNNVYNDKYNYVAGANYNPYNNYYNNSGAGYYTGTQTQYTQPGQTTYTNNSNTNYSNQGTTYSYTYNNSNYSNSYPYTSSGPYNENYSTYYYDPLYNHSYNEYGFSGPKKIIYEVTETTTTTTYPGGTPIYLGNYSTNPSTYTNYNYSGYNYNNSWYDNGYYNNYYGDYPYWY